MNTSNAEQERKQDNQDLMKQTFKDEMKKTHRIDWADMIAVFIGTMLGLFIQDVIDTEKLISNTVLRFCVDVLIIVIAITVVHGIIALVKKLTAKKQS
jgi:Na+/H+-dicarboxylate symporter